MSLSDSNFLPPAQHAPSYASGSTQQLVFCDPFRGDQAQGVRELWAPGTAPVGTDIQEHGTETTKEKNLDQSGDQSLLWPQAQETASINDKDKGKGIETADNTHPAIRINGLLTPANYIALSSQTHYEHEEDQAGHEEDLGLMLPPPPPAPATLSGKSREIESDKLRIQAQGSQTQSKSTTQSIENESSEAEILAPLPGEPIPEHPSYSEYDRNAINKYFDNGSFMDISLAAVYWTRKQREGTQGEREVTPYPKRLMELQDERDVHGILPKVVARGTIPATPASASFILDGAEEASDEDANSYDNTTMGLAPGPCIVRNHGESSNQHMTPTDNDGNDTMAMATDTLVFLCGMENNNQRNTPTNIALPSGTVAAPHRIQEPAIGPSNMGTMKTKQPNERSGMVVDSAELSRGSRKSAQQLITMPTNLTVMKIALPEEHSTMLAEIYQASDSMPRWNLRSHDRRNRSNIFSQSLPTKSEDYTTSIKAEEDRSSIKSEYDPWDASSSNESDSDSEPCNECENNHPHTEPLRPHEVYDLIRGTKRKRQLVDDCERSRNVMYSRTWDNLCAKPHHSRGHICGYEEGDSDCEFTQWQERKAKRICLPGQVRDAISGRLRNRIMMDDFPTELQEERYTERWDRLRSELDMMNHQSAAKARIWGYKRGDLKLSWKELKAARRFRSGWWL
jgi:hypothetical protein